VGPARTDRVLLEHVYAQAPIVPLPSDIKIDMPAADVPANVSRFAGAWAHGAWDGVLPHAAEAEATPNPTRSARLY